MKKKNKKFAKKVIEIVLSVILIICAAYLAPQELPENNEVTTTTLNEQVIETLPPIPDG